MLFFRDTKFIIRFHLTIYLNSLPKSRKFRLMVESENGQLMLSFTEVNKFYI